MKFEIHIEHPALRSLGFELRLHNFNGLHSKFEMRSSNFAVPTSQSQIRSSTCKFHNSYESTSTIRRSTFEIRSQVSHQLNTQVIIMIQAKCWHESTPQSSSEPDTLCIRIKIALRSHCSNPFRQKSTQNQLFSASPKEVGGRAAATNFLAPYCPYWNGAG